MTGRGHGVTHDDHPVYHQGLDDGKHRCFLPARNVAGSGKSGPDFILHLFSDTDEFIKYLFQLGGHGPEINRRAGDDCTGFQKVMFGYLICFFYDSFCA